MRQRGSPQNAYSPPEGTVEGWRKKVVVKGKDKLRYSSVGGAFAQRVPPLTPHKTGCDRHVYKPGTQKVEAGGSKVQGHSQAI